MDNINQEDAEISANLRSIASENSDDSVAFGQQPFAEISLRDWVASHLFIEHNNRHPLTMDAEACIKRADGFVKTLAEAKGANRD